MLEIEEVIQNHIDIDFYGTYEPRVYPRSGDVEKTPEISGISTSGNLISSRIELNHEELRETPWTAKDFNGKTYSGVRHKSTIERQELLNYIVDGSFRDVYSDTDEEGKNILKESLDEIFNTDMHLISLVGSLRKKGIQVKIR